MGFNENQSPELMKNTASPIKLEKPSILLRKTGIWEKYSPKSLIFLYIPFEASTKRVTIQDLVREIGLDSAISTVSPILYVPASS